MRTPPWWLGWLLVGGLLLLFLGERVLGDAGWPRLVFSGLGALAVLAAAIWRALGWRAAEPERRGVEGALALAYAGCVAAVVIYLAASEADAGGRARTVLLVAWTLVLALSLLPALAAQLAAGGRRRADGGERIEALRVLEAAGSGLVVALAGASLLLLGYAASARDKTVDLSYFKTATPGAATEAMIGSAGEPIHVILFFPDVNPVKDEVLGYFRRLADATGRLTIEERDRLAFPALAEQHQITQDGTILFVRGDRTERLSVGADLQAARRTLRALDRQVQAAVLPLLRGRRVVYLTTGHGELPDSAAAGAVAARRPGEVGALRQLLGYLGYDVKEIGLVGGLGRAIPDDAGVVMVLGPQRPFLPEELQALDRYLARGGSLALALDPEGGFELGPLARRLGVRFAPEPLANEQQHLQQRGDESDRRLIVTDQFSAHASVTTLARAGQGAGVLMVGPGRLERADSGAASPVFVVRSLPGTFVDADRDYTFDDPAETMDAYNLVAAVDLGPAGERSAPTADSAGAPPAGRALVFASSSVFSDPVLVSIGPNAALVADAVKWLARDEAFAGATESEEDQPVIHTRGQDVALFYAAILGAPVLVLAGGLLGVHRRRRAREAEA